METLLGKSQCASGQGSTKIRVLWAGGKETWEPLAELRASATPALQVDIARLVANPTSEGCGCKDHARPLREGERARG